MMEYKFLFCISGDINNIVLGLESYAKNKDYKFQIEHISDYSSLISYRNFDEIDCIIIQEFLDAKNPISLEYLSKLLTFKDLKIICIFDESNRNIYAKDLCKKGLYNCFFGEDAAKLSIDKLTDIMINGRSFEEAKIYYNIKGYDEKIKKPVLNELIELAKLYKGEEDLLIEEFNIITEELSDFEIRNMILQIPSKLIESFLCIPKFYTQYQKVKENILNAEKSNNFISLDKINAPEIKLIPVNSKNIGVVSLSQGAGASFFTINFAKALSEFMKVSVIEMPLLKPYMYYYLGLNALCAEEIIDFTSYAHLINENKPLENNYYVHSKNEGIYWIIPDASKYQIVDWDFTKMMRLLYMPKPSSMNIVDLGDKLFNPSITNIIEQFYMIIVIIDPMIPNVLNNFEYLEKIKHLQKEKNVRIEYIINKHNKGINENELINFLDVKNISYLPYVNSKSIYKAVYDADIPYNISDVREKLSPVFDKLIKMIVPKEIYKQKNSKGIFKKFKI